MLTIRLLALLLKQQQKFQKDLANIRSRWAEDEPSSKFDLEAEYAWAWLIVNTRSFYWDYPEKTIDLQAPVKKRKRVDRPLLARDDCMCLCPYLDYLNHTAADDAVSAL